MGVYVPDDVNRFCVIDDDKGRLCLTMARVIYVCDDDRRRLCWQVLACL